MTSARSTPERGELGPRGQRGSIDRPAGEPTIRVALLDDHPAVLAGVQRLIGPAPDVTVVAAALGARELTRQLAGRRPDVVVVDYDVARGDSLSYCQYLKRDLRPPAVIVYSAYASSALTLAARVAGADAVVDKAEPASTLLAAIRAVARGATAIGAVPIDVHRSAVAKLDDADLPILAMLLDDEPFEAIAQTLDRDPSEIAWRARRIVACLRPRLADPRMSPRG